MDVVELLIAPWAGGEPTLSLAKGHVDGTVAWWDPVQVGGAGPVVRVVDVAIEVGKLGGLKEVDIDGRCAGCSRGPDLR